MLILISAGAVYSRNSIDGMKLTQFTSELQIIERKLGIIAEEKKLGSNAYDNIGIKVTELPSADKIKALGILEMPELDIPPEEINNFILLSADDLNTIGVSKIKQDVLVNYNIQMVVSFTGITIGGEQYYW